MIPPPDPPRASAVDVAVPVDGTTIAFVTLTTAESPTKASRLPEMRDVEVLKAAAIRATEPTVELAVAVRTESALGPTTSTDRVPACTRAPLPMNARLEPSTNARTVNPPIPIAPPVPPAVSATAVWATMARITTSPETFHPTRCPEQSYRTPARPAPRSTPTTAPRPQFRRPRPTRCPPSGPRPARPSSADATTARGVPLRCRSRPQPVSRRCAWRGAGTITATPPPGHRVRRPWSVGGWPHERRPRCETTRRSPKAAVTSPQLVARPSRRHHWRSRSRRRGSLRTSSPSARRCHRGCAMT